MISNVYAENLKGLSFNHELQKFNYVFGPNGKGKSALSESLLLAVMGQVPGSAGKANQFVMNTWGGGDKMTVGVIVEGKDFARSFVVTGKGAVTQKYLLNGNQVTKENWIKEFTLTGMPAVLNLPEFMALSDQGKIDLIFDIFPPAGDVRGLTDKIATKNDRLNALRSELRSAEQMVSKLSKGKAEIELPAGNLSEVSAEIEDLETQLENAQTALAEMKEEQARAEAEEKAKAEAEEKAKAEREAAEKQAETSPETIEEPFFPEIDENNAKEAVSDASGASETGQGVLGHGYICEHDPFEAIETIINAIESVGCPVCSTGAAMMVAKQQLSKFKLLEKVG